MTHGRDMATREMHMSHHLTQDSQEFDRVLASTLEEATRFLSGLDHRPPGAFPPPLPEAAQLPQKGVGSQGALETFKERYASWLSGSPGPRYFGFVTGGVTPAALAGDWLASTYDQNVLGSDESIAPQIELDTIALLRQLFRLSEAHSGAFVTGATMSNFVGLALARQWLGRQQGIDVAQQGLWLRRPVKLFSGTPHASIYKALSMLGMGRDALAQVACSPGREAVDLAALEGWLKSQEGEPCIVVANAGTVNSVDFDDLMGIAGLKERYSFWMHVDAAFGGFAACSPLYRHLVEGMELADSITIDVHKWLNVPYDAALQFSRHHQLQTEVFQNAAVYLGQEIGRSNFIHLTPENSRRLRALPSWFTLMAYGRLGHAEIVERNCRLAQSLGAKIDASEQFKLLSPVRMNGLCFTLASKKPVTLAAIHAYLKMVRQDGVLFLTPTLYQDMPAIRISITNWRTTQEDVDITWESLQRVYRRYESG